jgi:hypothetical protein
MLTVVDGAVRADRNEDMSVDPGHENGRLEAPLRIDGPLGMRSAIWDNERHLGWGARATD